MNISESPKIIVHLIPFQDFNLKNECVLLSKMCVDIAWKMKDEKLGLMITSLLWVFDFSYITGTKFRK